VKFHHNLGQKVICMFHGVFMSGLYTNELDSYKIIKKMLIILKIIDIIYKVKSYIS